MLSCRSREAPEVDSKAPNREIYPSWQLLQQHLPAQQSCSAWTARRGPCNEPSQRGAAARCALVHALVTPTFYLRSWAPALQTRQDHPLAPDRQLAPSPADSSAGKTTSLQGKQPWARAEGVTGAPAPGRSPARVGAGIHVAWTEGTAPGLLSVYMVQPRSLASSSCFLLGRKPHRLRHTENLLGFLGLPHTLPGQNWLSCGSM